ncbi:MAG: SusC/RagA family TonB-linked outer membrane protein [Flavitalea sp.]
MRKSHIFLWIPILLLVPLSVFCQSRQISGTVTDQNNSPVPLASVVIKGLKTGVTADENGRFTITVPSGNAVLVVSSAGFASQELRIGSRDSYTISLASGDALSEVVVTALGITREKRTLGYSAQEVKGEELTNSRQSNIVNALRGKVAGVQINSGGGAPGQGSRIVIRGIKSLDPTKDNQPLFVIDGVVMDNSTTTVSDAGAVRGLSNRASDINPDDVETISVLRGGAATALYGLAGANGVIVITTKSAKAGKMRVNFLTSYGLDEVNKFPDVQMKFTQGNNGVYSATEFFPTWGPTVQEAKAIDPTHPDAIFHHYKRGYEQGNQFRSSINLSGGTENALVSSSISYFKQNGVIPNSDYKNISGRLNAQLKFGTKFKFNPSFYFSNSGGLRVNADRFNESLTYWSPRWDVKDYIKPDGTMITYLAGNNNPIYGTYSNRFKDDVNRIITNMAMTYSPIKWFDLSYRFGMDYYADFRRHAAPGPMGIVGEIPHEDNDLGFVDEYRISNRVITSNLMGTFKHNWSDKFSTVLRVGNDVRDIKYSRLTSTGAELDIPDLLSLNNAKVRGTTQYEELYRIVSAYGDLALSWNNFLFLNITGRNDWTSTLPQGNNSFFYPSVSLSYVFSDHFGLPSWWTFGKLRASYAEIGKDTKPYETNTYYNSSVLTSTSQVIWTRGDSKGDPFLQPERTYTIEAGLEARFFESRLGLDLTFYKLNSKDQIINVSTSPTTGFTSFILNSGELENKGIEIVLNGSPVKTKDFTWDATINFSANRNKVVSLREGLAEIVVGTHFGYASATASMKYVPGYAVGNIYGASYLRYYGNKADDKINVDHSLPLVIASTGTNRGFPVRDGTQRILGNSQPDWIAGINNSLTYKNLTVSFLFETQQGLDKYNQLSNFMSAFGIAKYTENRRDTKTFEGVLPDGTPNTQVVWLGQAVGPDGRNYTGGFYRNVFRGVTENFVEDASWVRLRTLSLGYELPARLFKGTIIQSANVAFTGNNLFLWTDYTGYDPESSSFSASSNIDAFAGFTYPAIRSYLITVNLNF